jgi:hypothetical protein
VLLPAAGALVPPAPAARGPAIPDARRRESRPPATAEPAVARADEPAGLRFHETLELVGSGGTAWIRCLRCGASLGPGSANYKLHALRRDRHLETVAGRAMPGGRPYRAVFREYACPGCTTLLQVDVWTPALGGEEDLWDIRIEG